MKQSSQLGLGNSVNQEIEILHTGVIGRTALGRICDLVGMWCEKTQNLSTKHGSDIRMMIQSLLDFAHPRGEQSLGQFEFAVEDQQVFASVRFQNEIFDETDSVERTLSQFWLNSPDASTLKKLLYPKDRVEVRYNRKLNLIEWRVCRSLKTEGVSVNDLSFIILIDEEPVIETGSKHYTDLGDLPYQDWLSSVYRNAPEESRSGEFFVNGESLQQESEWARVVSEKEVQELDDELKFSGKHDFSASAERQVIRSVNDSEDVEVTRVSSMHVEGQFSDHRFAAISENVDLKNIVKESLLHAKKQELLALRDAELAQNRVHLFEKLLRKKELIVQKSQNEIRILNQKIKDQEKLEKVSVRAPESQSDQSFKEKAMQMFLALKKEKEKNQELERRLTSMHLQNELASTESDSTVMGGSGVAPTYDDLLKRLERNQRALDVEKSKVASLSERVIVAEKGAQISAPMVAELERKVETTLKTVQQHKKETEVVKQKLVQAEAEKNKIKNELVKAHAEMKTLMKRHAS